ncbi:MAG TPA: hypothetical protein VFQ60_03820 [Patescibacteria group bacterium]|nr:hypothetical protein [Patescibacteria group bacterium]
MRHISGFVWCVTKENRILIFGASIDPDLKGAQNIQSNGLTPFSTAKEARQARDSLTDRGLIPDFLGRLSLDVMESMEDSEALKRSKNLVVIQWDSDQQFIFGKPLSYPTAHPLPCDFFFENGFVPFDTFAQAERVAEEVVRQSLTKAVLATWTLHKI